MTDAASAIIVVLKEHFKAREANLIAVVAGLRSRIEFLERAAARDTRERRQALEMLEGVGDNP